MAARSPYPKCPACRRKHDPRFTAIGWNTFGKLKATVIHNGQLYSCCYEKGADINQFLAEQAERQRKEKELDEFGEALRRFKGDHVGLMAWMEARARGDLNRERKLDALRRLAEDPRTPTGEAQAARAAIQRLGSGGKYS